MSRENELARIAARFFAPAECRQLDAAPADSRRELFFAFWTLKEAYIKATGHGLSMPLADFAFDLAASPSVSFAAHIEDDPRAWCFWHQHLLGTHALAIALRCPPEMAPMFRVSSAPLDHLTGR
jgi:4'-phosphopantetheinyl transferase